MLTLTPKFYLLYTLLLGFGSRAAAQAPDGHNPATDTVQPASVKLHYPVSSFGSVGGRVFYVFITSVSERGNGLEFTWRNPLVLPHPKPVFITSEQLQWVRLDGHYSEPVRVPGEKAHGLAVRLTDGPRVEVFDVATPKKGVPIPIPVPGGLLMPVFRVGGRDKFNHDWYLRRPGEKTMTPVPSGKKFAPFLASYLADAPALAAAIRAGAEGYRYDDLPQLLSTYNGAAAAGSGN
ncbi:MAG: hypothetical protein EOO36_21480 [Cytophagaceae bacterium]|nr:MAG: hypothetical protein EOO36_21480 [Cytophagaceae bacterium]